MTDVRVLFEHKIRTDLRIRLVEFLEVCFPTTFEGRSYFKQRPHIRLVSFDGETLIGHLGIDARIINIGGCVHDILGVIDICVRPKYRGRKVGTALLRKAEEFATYQDFMVLMADRHDLYIRQGYQRVSPAHTKWLAIENRESVLMIERDLSHCFMVKPIRGLPWPEGKIDMLGYLF